MTPPTHFATNEFTEIAQEIVDTYGVPRYKEANPALFTTVTFPFLFGVMFGDIGHGLLLFLAASVLVMKPHWFKTNAALQQLVKLRYMIFMMGFFAIFCGFIYNDFLSIPLNLFGSCYNLKTGIRLSPNCVYPAGIDPVWYLSEQELTFLNSVKMKIAVIFGVGHMLLGLAQKGINAKYFGDKIDFWHEFLPQVILLTALFGYMDLLIIKKWL